MKNSRACPLNVMLILTALVLLVHLALLQSSPLALGLSQTPPPPPPSFTTRMVALTPLAPATTPPRKRPAAARAAPAPAAPVAVALRSDDTTPPAPASPAPPEAAKPPAPTTSETPPAAEPLAAATPPPPIPASAQPTVPGSARISYKVEANKFPFSANAELLWQQDGKIYSAQLALSAFGQTRVQTSRGEILPSGLAPLRFSDKYRSEVAAHFNREYGKVTFSANTPDVPLQPGAQDRLSVLLQLAALIANDPEHYAPASTLSIQTIGPRDADTWLFTVGSEEKIKLPGGELMALKLERKPRQEFDQKVELWLAPAQAYLPVRIRITEANGDFIDQQWLATEPLAWPPEPRQ
jgi:hypothetical protein